jgi:glycosyltransferase involved in cell wall biosynthesis
LGGGTASVALFIEELQHLPMVQALVLNISPPIQTKKIRLVSVEKFMRCLCICSRFIKRIDQCDAVLVFATASFIFSIGTFIIWYACRKRRPIFLKPLGGDLFAYMCAYRGISRRYMKKLLSSATGVMTQTRQLHKALSAEGCDNVVHIPGYRRMAKYPSERRNAGGKLKIIFLSQIIHEKGPLTLLEALRELPRFSPVQVQCDFYGPILAQDYAEFTAQLAQTAQAAYCGTVPAGSAVTLMRSYDLFVFPTFFWGEGHPGVILEAMHAGIPVITTRFKAIPELIRHNENGILVPVLDSTALAIAIAKLASDTALRDRMGSANLHKAIQFSSQRVIPRMVKTIFPELPVALQRSVNIAPTRSSAMGK